MSLDGMFMLACGQGRRQMHAGRGDLVGIGFVDD